MTEEINFYSIEHGYFTANVDIPAVPGEKVEPIDVEIKHHEAYTSQDVRKLIQETLDILNAVGYTKR